MASLQKTIDEGKARQDKKNKGSFVENKGSFVLEDRSFLLVEQRNSKTPLVLELDFYGTN